MNNAEYMYVSVIIGLMFYILLLVYVAYIKRHKMELDSVFLAFVVTLISFIVFSYKMNYVNDHMLKESFV